MAGKTASILLAPGYASNYRRLFAAASWHSRRFVLRARRHFACAEGAFFQHLDHLALQLPQALQRGLQNQTQRLARATLRLELLDPHLVLQRGYAWLSDAQGQTVSTFKQTYVGQAITATLVDGAVDLTVVDPVR